MSMEPSAHPVALQVEDLQKGFNGRSVLNGIDLEVPRGSIFSVLGPSGTGKSVLLKCLANIMQSDAGRIRFDGLELSSGDSAARDEFRRRCSFLFQSNALFDSLTALENVALPLEQTTTLGTLEILKRCRDALEQLEMEDFLHSYPAQLSGGMHKRLA